MAIGNITNKTPHKEDIVHAQEEAPSFEKVDWKRDPGLRKLYACCLVLCVASATTGYDGYERDSALFSTMRWIRYANGWTLQHVLQFGAGVRHMESLLQQPSGFSARLTRSSLPDW